ncbi:MAG: hypothetical protein ACTHOE_12050 [Conexibacter sp.]
MSKHEHQSDEIPGGVELLRAAYKTVQAAGLPAELNVAAFEGALGLALRKVSSAVSPGAVAGATVGEADGVAQSGGGRVASLAQKLGLPVEQVAEVFYEDDGRLELGLAASRFGSTKSEATRRIGLLIAVARQFDGEEHWTPVEVLREACQEYNAFDVSNFARHILSLDDVLQFQGSGAQRKVRLTRPGLEKAADFIRELTS